MCMCVCVCMCMCVCMCVCACARLCVGVCMDIFPAMFQCLLVTKTVLSNFTTALLKAPFCHFSPHSENIPTCILYPNHDQQNRGKVLRLSQPWLTTSSPFCTAQSQSMYATEHLREYKTPRQGRKKNKGHGNRTQEVLQRRVEHLATQVIPMAGLMKRKNITVPITVQTASALLCWNRWVTTW